MKNLVVCVSRTCGSGGSSIAKLLANKLGLPLYDRNLLSLAAETSGINEDMFMQADEKLRSSMLFKAARKVYLGEKESADNGASDRSLFNYQAKVLMELAETGSFVVVGRCADYVLRDHPNLVRVFITAEKKNCISREADRNGITKKEAALLVDKVNRERSEYYAYNTGLVWSHADNYDLCINSAVFSYEDCVEVIYNYLITREKYRETVLK
ncbi:MAG: cytidylate kinase-like family protein [Clostridia bacterium]|nr:cytidylate kinase-like family protein [Clostridia bacterium]